MPRDLHQIKHNVYQLQILSVIQVRSYLTLCFKFKLDSRLGFIFYTLDETFVWDGLLPRYLTISTEYLANTVEPHS